MEAAKLDARGLLCPLPVLKARRALRVLSVGDTLEVLATDRGAWSDFEAFCRTTGNELVEREEMDGEFRFVIRKLVG